MRLIDIDTDILLVLRNLVILVKIETGVKRQRCQPSFGPVSLFTILVSPTKKKRLEYQTNFGLISRVPKPDSPLTDSIFHDIASKDP